MDKFDVILADPPWVFTTWSERGKGRSPERHYSTMTIEDIASLAVSDLASDNAALFLWATYPTLPDALRVMKRWSFDYRTVAFTWAKYTKSGIPRLFGKIESWRRGMIPASELERFLRGGFWHIGTGYYSRANPEPVLLGIRGKMPVADRGVRNLIVSPVGRHSAKPKSVYDAIERLYPGKRYLELFARERRDGWTSLGNEISGRDIREDIRIIRDRIF